jgi:hypothetical protein
VVRSAGGRRLAAEFLSSSVQRCAGGPHCSALDGWPRNS